MPSIESLTTTERDLLVIILDRFVWPWGKPNKAEERAVTRIQKKLGLTP